MFSGKKNKKNDVNDIEFEKSRMEILKMSNKTPGSASIDNLSRKHERSKFEKLKDSYSQGESKSMHAWEYELEEHRRRKKLEKMLIASSVLGVIGFVISLILLVLYFMK